MTKKTHDLYLLADGTHARPADCEPDVDGILRHIYGMPVALDGEGNPETVQRGAVDNKNVEAAQIDESAAPPADAASAEEPPAGAVDTLIDPATGQSAEETTAVEPADAAEGPVTETDDDKPSPEAKEVVAAPGKKRKTRDMGAGPAKTYKTR